MTPEYRNWLIETFAPLGKISVRRVFGFHGLYAGDVMFGLVTDERIFLKTDESGRDAFQREGSTPLTYTTRDGENIVTSYWEIPDTLYDEPDGLVAWAKQAHAIASNSATAKRKRARADRQTGARRPVRRRNRS